MSSKTRPLHGIRNMLRRARSALRARGRRLLSDRRVTRVSRVRNVDRSVGLFCARGVVDRLGLRVNCNRRCHRCSFHYIRGARVGVGCPVALTAPQTRARVDHDFEGCAALFSASCERG